MESCHSAVVWLPAQKSLCSLNLWCFVEFLPHRSLWKCSGSPLLLRDLQLHGRIHSVGLFSSSVWASAHSLFSSGKSSWVISSFCLLHSFCLVSPLFGCWASSCICHAIFLFLPPSPRHLLTFCLFILLPKKFLDFILQASYCLFTSFR